MLGAVFILLSSCASLQTNSRSVKSPQNTGNDSGQLAERIDRIEHGFAAISVSPGEPALQPDLSQLMQVFNVPGLSVAVIDNYKIAWAKGYGLTEAGGSTPVTTDTLFQAGSISKMVAAIAALRLVESGRLSLDEDVNDKLKSWKVPENEFTKQQKVTLRRILTHTAGTTGSGFNGYAAGEPIPTLLQILDGASPANSPPIRVDLVPGTMQRYSGGGMLIEQQLMLDVTGEPFPQIMREMVLERLHLGNSTYEQPLPSQFAPMAASGTFGNGKTVPGKWNTYPEMTVGGLWTTPSDLATIAIELALSREGKANRILSKTMTREMLTPQLKPEITTVDTWGGAQHPDRMGLSIWLGDNSDPGRFGIDGDAQGYVAALIMLSDTGQGAVVMANCHSQNTRLLESYLIDNIAKEYKWRYRTPTPWPALDSELLVTAKLLGAEAALRKWREIKGANPAGVSQETLIKLAYALAGPDNVSDVITILKHEVQEYPQYWNAYDSLGEFYVRAGKKQLAIESYEKSVELNPNNRGGAAALKKLKGQE